MRLKSRPVEVVYSIDDLTASELMLIRAAVAESSEYHRQRAEQFDIVSYSHNHHKNQAEKYDLLRLNLSELNFNGS